MEKPSPAAVVSARNLRRDTGFLEALRGLRKFFMANLQGVNGGTVHRIEPFEYIKSGSSSEAKRGFANESEETRGSCPFGQGGR
jgi:hypothetical protein